MHFEIPYVALLLAIMLMAVALLLQTFHFSNRLSILESKITELAKALGGGTSPPK